MGITYSSEAGGEPTHGSGATTADSHSSNHHGFSSQETQHLAELQRLVSQGGNKTLDDGTFLSALWKCSHLLSQQTLASSNSNTAEEIETHLAQQSPTQLNYIKKQCQILKLLTDEFPSLNKLNKTLQNIFRMSGDPPTFLERVSNILGMHGHYHKDSLDFICNCCSISEEGCVPAADVIKLCFQTASALNYIFQEDSAFTEDAGSIKLAEARDVSAEDEVTQSMTNSLLEYAKESRSNDHFFGGYSDPGVGVSSVTPNTPAEEGQVIAREFSEWQRKVVPDLIYCSIARFCHILFFPSELTRQSKSMIKSFPLLRSSKEITSRTTTKLKEGDILPLSSHAFGKNTRNDNTSSATSLLSPAVFAFASISTPKFRQKWYQIHTTDDGWTFQALEHAIMGYEGPTLLVIQGHDKHTKESVTCGAYTASKWERKRDFYGTSDCFLFQLKPTMKILKPLPKMGTRGGHYQYFWSNTNVNTTNPSRKDDRAIGLGFGGTVRRPRLFIDNHLEECHVSKQDTSFEEGNLGLPPSNDPFASQTSYSSTLRIDSLEIYAVGDEDTIQRGFHQQSQHRDINEATLRNARTVDKAAFLGDMRNGDGKTFAHRGQVDGRAHGYLKEEDAKANGLD